MKQSSLRQRDGQGICLGSKNTYTPTGCRIAYPSHVSDVVHGGILMMPWRNALFHFGGSYLRVHRMRNKQFLNILEKLHVNKRVISLIGAA